MGVAAEAARIIATEGQHNYHAAKKKAADRIGVSDRLALPSNMEIKEALYRYLDLYGGETHRENLRALRRTAVHAMRQLTRAGGHLAGALLTMVDIRKHAEYQYGDSGAYHGSLRQYYVESTPGEKGQVVDGQ